MTDATDTTSFDTVALQEVRQRLRRERQARVGILRNPNQPPKPPARRAALTGRWVNMHSSRRPSPSRATEMPGVAEDASASVDTPQRDSPAGQTVAPADRSAAPSTAPSTVKTAQDGRVLAIDVAGLMASVDDHADLRTGDSRTARTPFAAEFRPDITPQRRRSDPGHRPDARPSVLTAAAWLDDDRALETTMPQEDARHRSAPVQRSGRAWRIVVRLGLSMLSGMVLAVLILLALLGPPP